MLGGNFPVVVEGNHPQYNATTTPQLQLNGNVPTLYPAGLGMINYLGNENERTDSRPNKRVREEEPTFVQRKLDISVNNNLNMDKPGRSGHLLIPNNPPSPGLRLSFEKEECSSSVASTSENLTNTYPFALSLGNTVKMEMDRKMEELGQYIKLQEQNILKGGREISERRTISLLNALEKGVNKKLHEKDIEIENINRKNKELEDRIKQIAMEAQSWHYKAKYNETVANTLKSNIQQLMAQGTAQGHEGFGDSEVDDALSSLKHPSMIISPGNLDFMNHRLQCRSCKKKQVQFSVSCKTLFHQLFLLCHSPPRRSFQNNLAHALYILALLSLSLSLTSLLIRGKMQSTAIAFAPSLSLSTRPRKLSACGFKPLPTLSLGKRELSGGSAVSSWGRKLSPISCSLDQRIWVSGPNPVTESDGLVVRAAADSAGAAEIPKSNSSVNDTVVLGTLFGLWYLFNIYFNIYNKQVLKAFHYPMTVTLVQFAVGTVLVVTMWTLNLYKRPKISGAQLAAILPLALVHTLGNLFTNMSLGKVAVSFTHTIKAMEPFFSVVLSAMFLGELPSLWVVSSLLPIVGGVALASMTEASFNWAGFWSAMASNLTNQSRNVLSKKFMVKKEESLDNITLFSIITIMSFFLMAPIAFFMEGFKLTPSYLTAAGVNVNQLYTRSLLAALCFHAYQQVSYMILQRVSPVTHSVGNCVKRVVVIVTSVLFFRTPVSPINSIGTGIALAGVFLYSRVKRIKPKAKEA